MLKPGRTASLLLALLLVGSCNERNDATSGPPGPGAIRLTSDRYVVDENVPTAQVVLERVGGSEGELTAFVYCEPDTAYPGVDVNDCHGHTLTWDDGDVGPKTAAVTVVNDSAASGHKTVRWSVSALEAGIVTSPAEAVMVIRDDDAAGAPRIAFTRATPWTFTDPVAVASAPGDPTRLYVVEQRGVIQVLDLASEFGPGFFLDISTQVVSGGEAGLLGLTFDPDFASNGYFYVNYTTGSPLTTRISRFVASSPESASAASETILLSFGQPYSNHNGGWLGFGPDGKLYIGSGDGGSSNDPDNHGQRLDTLLGKILRINADGSIPADNPFASDGNAATLAPIWAYGLRNPWRGGFDRTTGDLWIGDVGQNAREEIDLIVGGGNYGWKACEGSVCAGTPPAGHIAPVFDYTHASVGGSASITGGYRYRGSAVPAAAGRYLYADFIAGNVWALEYDGAVVSNHQVAGVVLPSSFGEDPNGELYLASYAGVIYRMFGF